MLKLDKVTKTFGDIVAVNDVSFDISDGEFVFITGPSGSGKSTIIKLILRQLLPDSGEILWDDLNLDSLKNKEVPKIRQKMGVVFQDFKMINERTLRENIEIALAVNKVPPNEWQDRVMHVAKLVGLEKRMSLFPNQLAGGELQRGALARALVTNPTLILADEPTGNLDWETADKIMELFDQVNKEGKTILMASHHLGIVDKYKKRVVQLNEGKIVGDSGGKTQHNKKDEKKESDKDDDKDKDKKK